MKRTMLSRLLGTTALFLLSVNAMAVTPELTAQPVVVVPQSRTLFGITATTTPGANASSLVIKAGPGNLYSVYATNASATAGKLLVINATAVPSYGTYTTVLDCVALPASGTASINYSPGPPKVFSAGITALISSNASCYVFDQTTAVITGFISASTPAN